MVILINMDKEKRVVVMGIGGIISLTTLIEKTSNIMIYMIHRFHPFVKNFTYAFHNSSKIYLID